MYIEDVIDYHQAADYIAEELRAGNTLARMALRRLDFTHGRFRIAVLNSGQQRDLPYRWSGGFPWALKGPETLARLVQSFVQEPSCVVLVQETLRSPSDYEESAFQKPTLRYNNELYFVISQRSLMSYDDILDVISRASCYPFSAFFCASCVFQSGTLSDADLERAIDALVGVAVGVFDDYSFLFWWRDDLMPFPL